MNKKNSIACALLLIVTGVLYAKVSDQMFSTSTQLQQNRELIAEARRDLQAVATNINTELITQVNQKINEINGAINGIKGAKDSLGGAGIAIGMAALSAAGYDITDIRSTIQKIVDSVTGARNFLQNEVVNQFKVVANALDQGVDSKGIYADLASAENDLGDQNKGTIHSFNKIGNMLKRFGM